MWARLLAAAIGMWLMAAPAALRFGGAVADLHRVAGPLAASFAVIAMSQVTRPVRWCNAAVGAALVASPVVLDAPRAAAANLVLCGATLLALAFVRGRITERFGAGWRATWRATRERA